jgi:uncharacterized protein YecT (DUF1311 family)
MRITEQIVFAAALCFLFSSRSMAQHTNAGDAPCKHAGSGADLTQCFIDSSKKADADMNLLYRNIQKVVGGDELEKLKAAQRLWGQFRDANCSAERELYNGGSGAPAVYAACVEADTRQRTKELETMYGWRIEKFKP